MKQPYFLFFHIFFRYVKNLSTGREGWIPANNLLTLIGNSKSAQSLSSSGRLFILNEMIASLKIPIIKESCEEQPYNILLVFSFLFPFPRIRHCLQHFEYIIKLQ